MYEGVEPDLRILIVGYGSIGRRHARNLYHLGARRLSIVEPRAVDVELPVDGVFTSLDLAPLPDFDLVLITSPSIDHVDQAQAANQAGCHVFVEKPLATSYEQGRALLEQRDSSTLLTTACNMRYHPAVREIASLLEREELGAPTGYAVQAASWLPLWKPQSDYRRAYSARRELGGGALLDCIHEVDLVQWLFGFPDAVACFAAGGVLDGCDTEDRASATLRHGSVVGQLFLSFATPGYHRRQLISCERGSIWWDIASGDVEVVHADGASKSGYHVSPIFDFNQVYIDQLRHLLRAIAGEAEPFNPLEEALGSVAIVDALKESSEKERVVSLRSTEARASGLGLASNS